ncbi:MAG: tRNA uridine-5-carboxymethylaminomethyl(34) synthesis enzyme MnmG [Phycisphaerales bacterium]|nr:tRNA uridine-5-carboxymethylaminomethyl(34) synthesis enzyme MnmG [Phycisphaerales bacterium]
MDSWSVIIIGGGHAGAEAAWAASSALGSAGAHDARVILITMDPTTIGAMSCNPAIGGLAKGQMVREIDALGGIMGRAADATGIQFRLLNANKGAAVRGPRAQCDRHHYQAQVQALIATRSNDVVPIVVVQGLVESFEVSGGVLLGVRLRAGAQSLSVDPRAEQWNEQAVGRARGGERGDAVAPRMPFGMDAPRTPLQNLAGQSFVSTEPDGRIRIAARATVLTTGTFMRALMHTGLAQTEGGRVGEGTAVGISGALRELGFEIGRLKTGTPPRLQRSSIDWESLDPQWGDQPPIPFSALSQPAQGGGTFPAFPQVECRETRTTAVIHELVRNNLHLAPMYSGAMETQTGPRYCPSLEDKVVRFAERESHHVFLEPESLATDDIYCNGISTSLPREIQEQIIRGIPGCERAVAKRWGYAVEYDMVWPHQIDSTGQTKLVTGLFLAGQINGTSGYEEAASQGLVAGLNAARVSLGLELVRIGRDQAYIGVLMDDLVTRQPREPYRMFTSRAEYRLTLRADNAEDRLTALGVQLGLVDTARAQVATKSQQTLAELRARLSKLKAPESFGQGKRLIDIARRPEVTPEAMAELMRRASGDDGATDLSLIDRLLTDVRYEGYLGRQRAELKRTAAAENAVIPEELNPRTVVGLGSEAIEVLARFRPRTLGQASRLAGVTPSDISILELTLRRRRRAGGTATSC